MAFDRSSFFWGLVAAAVFAGFAMTAGGSDYAVTAVAVPLVVGLIGAGVMWFKQRKGAGA